MKKFAIKLFVMLMLVTTMHYNAPLIVEAIDTKNSDPISIVAHFGGGDKEEINILDNGAIVFSVTVNQDTGDDNKVSITLPAGIELMSAPGIASVDTDGNVDKKSLVGDETQWFEDDYEWIGAGAVDGVATKSGILSYNLKSVSSATITFQAQLNSIFAPIAHDELESFLGEIKAELSGSTTAEDRVTVNVTSIDRNLNISEFVNREILGSDILNEVYNKSIYIAPDRINIHNLSFKANVNRSTSAASYKARVLNHSFKITYPTGATLTQLATYSVTDVTVNDDGTTTATMLDTHDFNIDNTISSNFATIDFSGAYTSATPANTVFKLIVSDLEVTTRTFNPATQKFEEITLSNVGDENQNVITKTAILSDEVDSSLYNPYFKYEKTENEKYNDLTGTSQLLYSAMRGLNSTDKSWSSSATVDGSSQPIRMEYTAIPDDKSYLDKVTEVTMDVPFLGREGMARYTSQLKSVIIWYDSQDTGELGIDNEQGTKLDIADFQKKVLDGLLEDSKTSENVVIDADGIARYKWVASGGLAQDTPSIIFTAPEGESIVKIRMEFTGDNGTLWRNETAYSNSTVMGIPYDDEYTGIYSKYYFTTSQWNDDTRVWDEKVSSTIGGFRWLKPLSFELKYQNTSLNNQVYYYNVAKYNTQIPNSNNAYLVEGYQNLGSINVFNDTGAQSDEDSYVAFSFEKDMNSSDVIKRIKFPICPIEQEKGIEVIEYTYENGSKHVYYAGSPNAPYEIVNGVAILEASGDHKFKEVKFVLNSWGRSTDKVEFGLYGYLDDTSNLTSADEHKLSYDMISQSDIAQGLSNENKRFEAIVNSTFKEHSETGADLSVSGLEEHAIGNNLIKEANAINAGSSKDIEIRLVGGSYNHITNGSWTDITFNIVLPKGVTLTGLNARDFALEVKGKVDPKFPTNETAGTISYVATEMSEAEAKAHFGEESGITGGTIYTCTLDDKDVILYGYRNGKYQESFSSFKVDASISVAADTPSLAIPWSKAIYLGSNSTAYTGSNSFSKVHTSDNNLAYSAGVGVNVSNFDSSNKLRLGNTNKLVSGSEDQYIFITNIAQLSVNNAHINFEGENYFYSDTNPDSLAVLGRDDIGNFNFTVTNTVNPDVVDSNVNYVVVPFPTTLVGTSLSSEHGFKTVIQSVSVNGKVLSGNNVVIDDPMTISTKFIQLGSTALNSNNAASLFDNGSIEVGENDAMILQIENQELFNSFDVSVEFKMPNIETKSKEYVKLKGTSIYHFSGTSMGVYDSENDGNSYIRFAYDNPKYTVDFKGLAVKSTGEITGDIELGKDSIEVFVNNNVYKEATSNEDDIVISAPVIEGYEFKGWYADEDLTEEFFNAENNDGTPITGATTMYAKYEMKQIEVTFVYNYGDPDTIIVKTVNYSDLISRATTPEKPLHTFKGWYIDEELNRPLTYATYGEADLDKNGVVTLYAAYDINPLYTVTYDVDGYSDTQVYEEGDTVTILPGTPTKDGYTFGGWYFNGTVYRPETKMTMGTLHVAFEAVWTRTTYSITFKDDGVEVLEQAYHSYLEVVDLTSLDNKEGHTFKGWQYGDTVITDGELTMPSQNVELVAVWEKISYNVNLNGVKDLEISDSAFTFASDKYQASVEYGGSITLPTPVREGYVFKNWTSAAGDVADGATVSVGAADWDLTAVFEKLSYNVTYNTDGGDPIASATYEYQYVLRLPTTTKEGFDFAHWVDADGNEYPAGSEYVIPSKDTNFTAVWTDKEYIVNFVDNLDDTKVYFTYDADYNDIITIPAASKTGYTFNGWTYNGSDYSANDSFTVNVDDTVVTFVAKFDINEYTVSFGVDDKDTFPNIVQDYNTTVNIPTTTPVLEGNTFEHWVDGEGNIYNAGDSFNMPENGLDLKPVWKEIQYTIKFTGDLGDTGTLEDRVEKFGATFPLPTLTKEGSTFLGWVLNGSTLAGGSDYTVGASDVELVASWKVHSYDVEFDYKDGNEVVKKPYDHGSDITFELPVKSGYTFLGWYFDEDNTYQANDTFKVIKEGLKFTARWEVNEYEITFVETGDSVVNPIKAQFDTIIQFPLPTKKGYDFAGWQFGDTIYNANQVINMPLNGMKVKGLWNRSTLKVTFNHNYDSIVTTDSVKYEDNVTFVDPSNRVGYTFKGWKLDGTLYTSESTYAMGDKDITFVASWEAIAYKISFKDTGDSVLADVDVDYNSDYTIPTPVKNGYKFEYWMDEQGVIYRADQVIIMKDVDLVLTAIWTKVNTSTGGTTTPTVPLTPESTTYPSTTSKPTLTQKPSGSNTTVSQSTTSNTTDANDAITTGSSTDKFEPTTAVGGEDEQGEEILEVHGKRVCWICKKHPVFIFGICIRCFIIICICIAIILSLMEYKRRKDKKKRLEREKQRETQ